MLLALAGSASAQHSVPCTNNTCTEQWHFCADCLYSRPIAGCRPPDNPVPDNFTPCCKVNNSCVPFFGAYRYVSSVRHLFLCLVLHLMYPAILCFTSCHARMLQVALWCCGAGCTLRQHTFRPSMHPPGLMHQAPCSRAERMFACRCIPDSYAQKGWTGRFARELVCAAGTGPAVDGTTPQLAPRSISTDSCGSIRSSTIVVWFVCVVLVVHAG